MNRFLSFLMCFGTAAAFLIGCSNSSSSSLDTSGAVTESAVATVGGAVTSTNSDTIALSGVTPQKRSIYQQLERLLTIEPSAWAATTCPTVVGSAFGCSVAANEIDLNYGTSGCLFPLSEATWTGGSVLTVTPSNYLANCGSGDFPKINGTTVTAVNRTYMGTLGGATSTTRTNATGTDTVVVDTSTGSAVTAADFVNANGTTPSTGTSGWDYEITGNQGYTRTYVSASENSLSIGVRLVNYSGTSASGTAGFDHTLSTTSAAGTNTPLTVAISGTEHTVNGSLTLQHNLAKYLATSTFSSVVHDVSKVCCYPISGTVTTAFTGGPNDGKTETFTFSSATCATATMGQVAVTNVDGSTGTKTITNCF